MATRILKLVNLAVIGLLATACGGGGGGGGNSNTTPMPGPPPAPPTPALFQISGTITASSSQAVDSDTNDPAGTAVPNNSIASAQFISNPVTLGGYVNEPGGGPPGRSQASGDLDDYFQVDLLAGQSITMLVADFQRADADLYLFDTQGRILAASIESGEIESLTVPEDGTYIVNAFAFEGGTNYILAIGSQNTLADRGVTGSAIVPWQSVVKYRQLGDVKSAKRDALKSRLQKMGMEQRAGGPGRARLLGFKQAAMGGAEMAARAKAATSKIASIEDDTLRANVETLLAIKSLRQDPEIEFAEPNYRVRAMAIPNDEAYPFQWHYPLIDLPQAWDTTTGDEQNIVAVVDSGVLSNHPDLRGQLVAGYDFVRNPSNAGDGNGIDPNPEDPLGGGTAGRDGSHGTHVIGTVAAAGNNGIGVTGVAYGTKVMPLRALGTNGEGTSYDVEQAIRYAVGLPNDSGTIPNQPASIINLSLGGAPFSQSSQNLYRQVFDSGVILVASAGNEASSVASYPAAYEGVISVAAVDAQRRRAEYSNTGATIDIAAPGGDNRQDFNGDGYPDGVLSTDGAGDGEFGYTFLNGTSMSAPHVSGVIALMKAVNPDLSSRDINALLVRGSLSEDLGDPGRDDSFGHGLINAQKAIIAALDAAGGSPAENPFLSASASTLNFSTTLTTLELELRNAGLGELELSEVNVSEAWLGIEAENTDANKLGLYRVSVDREGLESGVYSGEIIARSSVNDLTIRVIMSVGGSKAADVGVVYILLYEQGVEEAVAQQSASSNNGEYTFIFENVPPGRYEIFAGSDADNDLLICDAGEACGAWLTFDQPIVFDLNADRMDVNFPVDYLVTIPNVNSSGLRSKQPQAATPVGRRTP